MDNLDQVKPYYKNPREDIWHLLPEIATRTLDVGCGTGAFAEACKQRYGCETWGIEFVPEMAEIARSRVDHVSTGDCIVEIPKLPEATFDLVTFTDVLEHLVEPAEALRLTKRVLAPGGRVIASIPNIRFWHALMSITRGRDFPYQDSGIFDRTHLRFFTAKSIPRLFEDAGYKIERIEGINPTPSRKFRLMNALLFNYYEDCRYLQYGVVATPK